MDKPSGMAEECFGYARHESPEIINNRCLDKAIQLCDKIKTEKLPVDHLHDIFNLLQDCYYENQIWRWYNIPGERSEPKVHNTICKKTNLYLIKNHRNGYVKIGISRKPYFREKTLQSEEPELELIFTIENATISFEKEIHDSFSDKRIRGEWFKLSDEDIQSIKDKTPF